MKAFALFSLFFVHGLLARGPSELNQKTYITPEQININSSGIFVFLQNEWIAAEKLESDESGIFVQKEQFAPWYCQNCNRWTSGWFVCEFCGNPK